MNLNSTIIPKSDQLNADDLIGGPRTIKITAVKSGNAEQPVSINYENDNGRPYKPCKSMRRVLVSMWGADGLAYVGRRLTIYRDVNVSWGGEPVGGIRISHASDINEPVQIALTASRGKRKPFCVEPLRAEQSAPALANLPTGWAEWSNEERGDNRATLGMDALVAWWGTLTTSEKQQLKPKLDTDWKPMAAKKGGAQ